MPESETLTLTAPVELTAAAGKPPRVSILAYSGGVMNVSGYGPLVIDLAGLELGGVVPLLADHVSTLDGVGGSGTPSIERGALYVNGTLAPETPTGQRVMQLHAAGVPLQASVGVNPTATPTFVRAGDSITTNGRTIVAGPTGLRLVTAGRLREVSITPLGADDSTAVHITAKGATLMPTEMNTTEAAPDPVQAERNRVKEIQAVCGGDFRDIEAKGIAEGWTVDAVRAAALAALRDRRTPANNVIAGHAGAAPAPIRAQDAVMVGALLMAGHNDLVARLYGERVAETAHRPSGWVEFCGQALQASGQLVPSGRDAVIRAAFSTASIGNVVGTAAQKIALEHFLDASSNWRALSRIVTATSFKEGKAVRLASSAALEKLGQGGEIKHGTLGDESHTFRVSTYARMFGITREDIINDDLGVLADLPIVLGNEGARTVSDLFFDTLIANAGPFYSTGNANKITTALAVGSLSSAITALRTQTDASGRIIGYVPTTLLVPAALEATARTLLNSQLLTRDQSVDNQTTASPIAGLNLGLVVEPRLDADSATDWYLFARPTDAAVLVAFLDGVQGPRVESQEAPFDRLGMQYRAYMDVGVSLAEHRATVKSDVA